MTQPNHGVDRGTPVGVLATALGRLVAEGTLTRAQSKAVNRAFRAALRAPGGTPDPTADVASDRASDGASDDAGQSFDPGSGRAPWSLLLAEVGGYVGAAFVLAAAVILVLGDGWDRLGVGPRFAVLVLPALLAAAAAVLTARTAPGPWMRRASRDPAPGVAPRRRLVSLLATVAAVLGGGGAGVLADAGGAGGDRTALVVSGTALLIAAGAYALCRAELLHVALGVGAASAAVASLRVCGWFGETSTGWAFVAVGFGWGLATVGGLLAERGLGFGWGGVLVFVGAQLLTTADPRAIGYAVLGLLAVTGLAGYSRGRSLTLLVIGVATLAVLVPQAVIDATDGGLGAAGVLLVVGLSIGGAAALGFRLHRTPAAPV